MQLDGPGSSELLDLLGRCVQAAETPGPGEGTAPDAAPQRRDRWVVVHFDAWQHQRLASPWWWLVTAIDRQIRRDVRTGSGTAPGAHARHRLRDWAWRLGQLVRDLWLVLLLATIAIALWILARSWMTEVLTSIAAVMTALTTVALVVVSAANKPLRRRLLLSSPQGDAAIVRTADPMADLRSRYAFVLREAPCDSVLVLVDNLDRCDAAYVVDLLEGLQTLLRHPRATSDELPFVAFVVAADYEWLCTSFLQKYAAFASTARLPGRRFGQPFLEKIFDLELRLPRIPAALSITDEPDVTLVEDERQRLAAELELAMSEVDVRRAVCAAEARVRPRRAVAPAARAQGGRCMPPPPIQCFREDAVERIGHLEYGQREPRCPAGDCRHGHPYQCHDTNAVLQELVDSLDAGACMAQRMEPAYCVQRTAQLLGGHELEGDRMGIRRLGLWTILATTWPLLAEHLVAHPADIERLRDGRPPMTDDPDLRLVFQDRSARQVGIGVRNGRLEPDDIIRYTRPIDHVPAADAPSVRVASLATLATRVLQRLI